LIRASLPLPSLHFFLMGLFRIENIENYLIVSVSSILLSLVFLVMIIKKYDLEVAVIHHTKQPETRFSAVILLSIFLALSITSYLFVERTYLTVLNVQYSGREAELLRFITWFNGSILVFSFIFQTFFNDAIIANYGLKVSLLILPVVLSVFVITTVLLGLTIGTEPRFRLFCMMNYRNFKIILFYNHYQKNKRKQDT